ncbi:MAG: CPBP family intramembrane metalloprotease [Planctomycetes bacterium]|nr:CPBP family intramembrane metalloprotease [Planctomycetota bacterium]
MSAARQRGAVLRNELRGLLRDRRALFSGLVLPLVLYPFLLLGQGWLERIAQETLEAKQVVVVTELAAAPADEAARIEARLAEDPATTLRALAPGALGAVQQAIDEGTEEAWFRERELVLDQLGGDGDALLWAAPDPESPDGTLYRLHYDGADDTAREARDRAREVLDDLGRDLEAHQLDALLGGDPAALVVAETRDLASEEDKGGALLGRLLPLMAVLVLLSGGSYAALSAFAGEREGGTLETLLVQPVPASALVWGKFSAVLLTGLAALVLNLVSLLGSVALGLGELPGGGSEVGGPGFARFAVGGVILAPLCLLLSALLSLVCGRARSFREGQHYLLPLSLVAMLPAALATQPEVELDLLLACVPLAGPALAFRDAMVGQLAFGPGAFAVGSTLVWAALCLRKLGSLLDAERVLADRGTPEELAARRVQSKNALAYGWAGVLLVYVLGGLVQSLHAVWGLVATLWVLLPTLAVLSARGTARRAGERLVTTLGLRAPRPSHLAAALLAAPALARLAGTWIEWQQRVLPLPSSMTQGGGLPSELLELSPRATFLLLALSPAICEELFFRGAVLSGLRRDLPAWRVVAWQALLFGAVHASIYRFAPTACLGALLAALVLRGRSLWPAVVLHATYNGLLILGDRTSWFAAPWVPWLLLPAVLLACVPARAPRTA